MRATFRALAAWPYLDTPAGERRSRYAFQASWPNTLDLLEREVRLLAGHDVIVAGLFREQDIRMDGLPRANAYAPPHPGIEISFDSIHGRLVYATDV